MIFRKTELLGAVVVEPEAHSDHRGFFARTYCEREFAAAGLAARFVQCNISFNLKKGTIRGMHFQIEPQPEPKLVRCTQGRIYDVIVDLRKNSPTLGRWIGEELTAVNRHALYVPPGFAHGFQTLEDETEVFYQMGEYYNEKLARGVRWNDPRLAIHWPIIHPILSDRDASYPDFERS